MKSIRLALRTMLVSVAATAVVVAAGCATSSVSAAKNGNWIGTWGTSAAAPAPTSAPYNNQTLRLIAHVSAGGDEVRIRLANTFGTKKLDIGAATIGLQNSGASLIAGTTRALTFSGRATATIPPGALVVSDPVSLKIKAQSNVAVSVYLPNDTGLVTAHPGANQDSFVSTAGNFASIEDGGVFSTKTPAWPYLAGIEVKATHRERTLVTFGDSITDGYKSTIDANRRWPDYFMARLAAAGRSYSIVNAGISGNRLLHDSAAAQPRFGPNALSRFDRDALTVSGATHVVVLIGINDIGMGSPARTPAEVVSAEDIIAAHQQLLTRAKARGLKVIAATLLPFRGAAYFTEEGEQKRLAVNAWLRANKNYDGLIDFDKATQDPEKPSQMLAAYDSGDHLHPNDAGYKAMADSINLALFD